MPVFYARNGSRVVPGDDLSSMGPLSAANTILSGKAKNKGERSLFTGIGLGKPLAILLRHVYSGMHPKESFFRSSKDLLVTSALRDLAIYNAAPRAVNVMQKGVKAGANVICPSATEKGTPVIYYSPAITASAIILTIDIAFDNFPEAIFESASTALSGLVGVPLFMPYVGYLMGASTVVKLAAEYGNALFDSAPAVSVTVRLDFDTPGASDAEASFRVLCEPDFDPTALTFVDGQGLVTTGGKPYDGKSPYVVVSLDGKKKDDYENFTPALATAVLLNKFYASRDKSEASLDGISGVAKLFNDMQFREKALSVKQKMDASDAGSKEHQALQARYNALVDNIASTELRPPKKVKT